MAHKNPTISTTLNVNELTNPIKDGDCQAG